jgi:hypothetical protein
MPTDESPLLHRLEVEVEAELTMAESSESGEALDTPSAECMFDPTDIGREEVGLRSLLGAVEAVERDSPPVRRQDLDWGAAPDSADRRRVSLRTGRQRRIPFTQRARVLKCRAREFER